MFHSWGVAFSLGFIGSDKYIGPGTTDIIYVRRSGGIAFESEEYWVSTTGRHLSSVGSDPGTDTGPG